MTERAETDMQTLRAEVGDLRGDLAKISATVGDIARRRTGEAYQAVHNSANELKHEAQRTAKRVVHEMEQRPVTAAVTAFAVGVVLGLLFNHRSQSR